MMITTIGIDIAKSLFHVVAVNKMGTLVKRRQIKRKELLAFVAQLEPCRVAMEASAARTIGRANFRSWGTKCD